MAEPEVNLYHYIPSKPAAIVSTIVFAILLLIHIWRLFATRSWFCIPFIIGAIFEALGFATRAYGHSNPSELNPFIVQTLLILLAPILFAASVYMFLGRIIRATNESSRSMIRPTLMTKIFVGGDILCFLIQALGAGILTNAKTKSALDLGKYIILAGLLLQLLLVGFFVVVAWVFHARMNKSGVGKIAAMRWNWQRYLIMLYVVSLIITFRNLFRVIEYALGNGNYLLVNEWPIYAFDAAPMAIVLVICATWYVGDIVTKAQQNRGDESYTMMPEENRQAHGREISPSPQYTQTQFSDQTQYNNHPQYNGQTQYTPNRWNP